MANLVATVGRVLLPEPLERQALTVLEVDLSGLDGAFDPDLPVDRLSDLARLVGVHLTREEDWLRLSTDAAGEPRWTEQSEAFYRGLARFAREGEVRISAQDGAVWGYRYRDGSVTRVDRNGRATDLAGSPESGRRRLAPPQPPVTGSAPPPPAEGPADPAPGQQPPGPASWTLPDDPRGPRFPRPPGAPAEGPSGAEGLPGAEGLGPRPLPGEGPDRGADGGRRAAMAVLLIVGVLLVVGLAVLTAGAVG